MKGQEMYLGCWFFQNVRLKAKALCVSEKAQRRVIAALFQGGATHSDRARASFYLRFERIDGLSSIVLVVVMEHVSQTRRGCLQLSR